MDHTFLMCDGPGNGQYYRGPVSMDGIPLGGLKPRVGDEFYYGGSRYLIYEWPTGELVGVWS